MRAEGKLRLPSDALEVQVVERTVQLAEQARNLHVANSDPQQFAKISSHDLREPLRTIILFCGRLSRSLETIVDPEIREEMALVIDAANTMRQLIQNLLTYTNEQHHVAAFADLALGKVLAEAQANLQSTITESMASIQLQSLPSVVVDR